MHPAIIVMLTHNDLTVKNSAEVFSECADLPVKFWGFKDVGLPPREMAALGKQMKDAGKTTFLEVVTFTEEECLEAAQLAFDCGIDYFTGTVFFPSILEFTKKRGMKYYPFCGKVFGSPITLNQDLEEIIEHCKMLMSHGVDGVDLITYRSQKTDPVELTLAVTQTVGSDKVIVAGSINSRERIRVMNETAPFAYTVGGALFEKKFVPHGSFRNNLEFMIEMQKKFSMEMAEATNKS